VPPDRTQADPATGQRRSSSTKCWRRGEGHRRSAPRAFRGCAEAAPQDSQLCLFPAGFLISMCFSGVSDSDTGTVTVKIPSE
jgi:hypothetical protein